MDNLPFELWFLIGALLVFFMNAGFAMLETGFTRAKNAGNILMKNLIDFSVGAIMFAVIGYTLLTGVSSGFIGTPNWELFTNFAEFDYADFVFNLVFCATAATIVSGAMAERTKFSAYCIYSAAITAVIYPIQAGWVWNDGGWLAQLGFIDFAGSAVIHMVGGASALIGVKFLGARIGKYKKDEKTGKIVARAIPGHSLTLGALGVFILWFGWYGFNGAAAGDISQLGSILLTTTLSPAIAAVIVTIITWKRRGKPDVSMALNGALAGLVAITATCGNVDAVGSLIIGAVAAVLVVVAIEVIDFKLHADDPVGAIAVHGVNGVWGALAVGLFANPNVFDSDGGATGVAGLFYGGGFHQLGVQALGVVAILAWTIVTMTIVFALLKKFNGLRVSREEEIAGLDTSEHGLISSYADFVPSVDINTDIPTPVLPHEVATEPVSPAIAVPVVNTSSPGAKMTKVVIITNHRKFEALNIALEKIGITGMTVTQVMGYGMQKGEPEYYRGVEVQSTLLPKVKVEIVICKVPVETLVNAVKDALYTGNPGDGKIFIYDIENVIKISANEEGYDALQD